MKTNSSARGASRIWVVALCLAIAGIAGIEVRLADSLSARFGQAAVAQTDGPQAPNLSLAEALAAAHN